MELLQLRYFLTVAKYEHLTKAAKSLHIAQPSLSQSIHRLEKELGVSLFDRKSRHLTLNSSGKLLQESLLQMMEVLDHIPDQLKKENERQCHTLHLNILAASTIITNCIIAYKASHPDINFRLSQDEDINDYDLCISTKIPANHKEGEKIVLEEKFYLAVPTNSPYALLPEVDLRSTRHEGYICLTKTRLIRQICDQFCHEAGFMPHIIFESDNSESVRNLITAGLGIGFWPKYSWGSLSTDNVVLIPIACPDCTRDIIITFKKNSQKQELIDDFYHYVANFIRELETSRHHGTE